MNKFKIILLFTFFTIFFINCKVKDVQSSSQPISHVLWDSILHKHVSKDGWVNYEGIQEDSITFNNYISLLSTHHPNKKYWSLNERKAYWINAYNAFTVQLILDHYPVESIKDIAGSITFVNTAWDIKFIHIEGQEYDINNIEHGIIRPKFDDPRIHAAVNCASVSCPKLLNEAYTSNKLEQQLDAQCSAFLNDKSKNIINNNKTVQLSKIFKWYSMDFEDKIKFINQYSDVKITNNTDISYLDYDWHLNKQ